MGRPGKHFREPAIKTVALQAQHVEERAEALEHPDCVYPWPQDQSAGSELGGLSEAVSTKSRHPQTKRQEEAEEGEVRDRWAKRRWYAEPVTCEKGFARGDGIDSESEGDVADSLAECSVDQHDCLKLETVQESEQAGDFFA